MFPGLCTNLKQSAYCLHFLTFQLDAMNNDVQNQEQVATFLFCKLSSEQNFLDDRRKSCFVKDSKTSLFKVNTCSKMKKECSIILIFFGSTHNKIIHDDTVGCGMELLISDEQTRPGHLPAPLI